MRKERMKLESIRKQGIIPESIGKLFELTKERSAIVGDMANRNSIIYFLDIPDDIRVGLPTNLQRHCTRATTLATDFNRWLWEVGSNAPDLNATWNSSDTPRAAWKLLEKEFGANESKSLRGGQPKEKLIESHIGYTESSRSYNINKERGSESTNANNEASSTSSQVITSVLKPSECFATRLLHDDYPFNIIFSTKSEYVIDSNYSGPGIYSIFDQKINSLIYLGLWSVPRSVVKERFEKHIQSLTLRGSKVVFNKGRGYMLEEFINNFDSRTSRSRTPYRIPNGKLIQALRESTSMTSGMCRLHAGGIVATSGKPRYAAENWDEFGAWDNISQAMRDMDDRFVLQFDRIQDYFHPSLTTEDIKYQLKSRFEDKLIQEFNPLTNKEYDFSRPPTKFKVENTASCSQLISHRVGEIIST